MRNLVNTLTALLLFTISCGSYDDEPDPKAETAAYDGYVDEKPEEEEAVYYVELPKCTERKEERLVYVIYEEEFLVCRNGQWIYLPMEEQEMIEETPFIEEDLL